MVIKNNRRIQEHDIYIRQEGVIRYTQVQVQKYKYSIYNT